MSSSQPRINQLLRKKFGIKSIRKANHSGLKPFHSIVGPLGIRWQHQDDGGNHVRLRVPENAEELRQDPISTIPMTTAADEKHWWIDYSCEAPVESLAKTPTGMRILSYIAPAGSGCRLGSRNPCQESRMEKDKLVLMRRSGR
jgi:hypothetical protein